MSIDKVRSVAVVVPRSAASANDGVSESKANDGFQPKDTRALGDDGFQPKTSRIEDVRSVSPENARAQVSAKSASAGQNVVVFSIGTSPTVPDRVAYSPPPQFYATRSADERDPASTPF